MLKLMILIRYIQNFFIPSSLLIIKEINKKKILKKNTQQIINDRKTSQPTVID